MQTHNAIPVAEKLFLKFYEFYNLENSQEYG